jgi:hypothetical protein
MRISLPRNAVTSCGNRNAGAHAERQISTGLKDRSVLGRADENTALGGPQRKLDRLGPFSGDEVAAAVRPNLVPRFERIERVVPRLGLGVREDRRNDRDGVFRVEAGGRYPSGISSGSLFLEAVHA